MRTAHVRKHDHLFQVGILRFEPIIGELELQVVKHRTVDIGTIFIRVRTTDLNGVGGGGDAFSRRIWIKLVPIDRPVGHTDAQTGHQDHEYESGGYRKQNSGRSRLSHVRFTGGCPEMLDAPGGCTISIHRYRRTASVI